MAIHGDHRRSFDRYEQYDEIQGHVTILFLVFFLIFYLFIMILLMLDRELRKSSLHLVTGNIMLGHFLAAVFTHPGGIRVDLLYQSVTAGYCWFSQYLSWGYICFVPNTMVVYSVERLLYVQNPSDHKARIHKYALLAMVGLPWLVSIIFSILIVNGYQHELMISLNSTRAWDTNQTVSACELVNYKEQDLRERMGTVGLMACLVPGICCLTIMITTLIIWCCYKEHVTRGANYIELGEEVRAAVRDSVIAIAILNSIICIALMVNLFAVMFLPVDGAILSLFGVVQGLVWLGTIKALRDKLIFLVTSCCGLRSSGPDGAAHYQTEDAEDVAIQA